MNVYLGMHASCSMTALHAVAIQRDVVFTK